MSITSKEYSNKGWDWYMGQSLESHHITNEDICLCFDLKVDLHKYIHQVRATVLQKE